MRVILHLICAAAYLGSATAIGTETGTAASRPHPDAHSSSRAAQYIRAQMQAQGIPGLAVEVLRHGRPIYVHGFGVATLEHPVPATPDTRFQIGSVAKQFTAVALMLLAEEGRLNLDDSLSRYLPGIPIAWSAVTLRLMLNHQSGIPQLTPPHRELLDLHHDYTEDEYLRLATSLPLDFAPGTDASYSDTAYVLLGFVINRVTGRFYGEVLADRVFKPLQMSRTRILSDADIIVGRASGYERQADGALRNQDYVSPFLNRTADGSLYSTVQDLGRWDAALYDSSALPRKTLERMWRIDALKDGRRPLLHYGYGWEINTLRGERVIEYDGNWQGFQAAMARYPARNLSVIVLTNLSLCRAQRIVHTVAGLFDPALRAYPAAIRDAHPERTRKVRSFLDAARHDRPIAGFFGPHAHAALGVAWMGSLRRDLEELGPLQSVNLVEERPSHGERVYRAELEHMTEFFTVRHDADGAIDDIDLYHEY